ncbi:MAG: hypothetical protein JNL49_11075 [Bacteroidia bacterium]|nr:hypothetical protein [Bacteroidia bacterium]
MNEFKILNGRIVEKLFLIVWPPWGEAHFSDIDISFGFVFKNEPDKLYKVSVDKDELWSPRIWVEPLPDFNYSWEDFYNRMKKWMNAKDDTLIFGLEYYEVTKSDLFSTIVGSEIVKVELISVSGNSEPFGAKIYFEDDFIISLPNSDGNIVETSKFNKNDSINWFNKLGEVIYLKL